jgi:hypothetical protein
VAPGTSVSFGFDAATPGPAEGIGAVAGTAWVIRPEPAAPSQPNALCRIDPSADGATLLVSSPEYSDVTDSVSLEPLGSGESGLVLHAQDRENYDLVTVDAAVGRITIGVARNGVRTILASVNASIRVGAWQELSAQVRAATITAFLNGRRVAQATDITFPRGAIGLWAAPGASACFDNLMATGL